MVMALGLTYLLGILGVLQAIEAAPARPKCELQWGAVKVDGLLGENDVCRYSIKYGAAERWEEAQAVTTPKDGTGLPPACPQPGNVFTGDVPQSEDCLYMLVYVPRNANSGTPVFTWIHGGSYRIGGANQAGVNGWILAAKGQIVVIPQYRLGVLGMMPPASSPTASDPNLSIRDMIFALKSLQRNLVKCNRGSVTIGGNSSGATFVRALWGAPSAKGLFHRVALQSDPLGYGMTSLEKYREVRDKVYSHPYLDAQDYDALKRVDVNLLIAALMETVTTLPFASFLDNPDETLNPVFGTPTIPDEPTRALVSSKGKLAVNPRDVPLLITTVTHEGEYFVGAFLEWSFPPIDYVGQPEYFLGKALEGRCANGKSAAGNIPAYQLSSVSTDHYRTVLSRIITDGYFECPARMVASSWVKKGGVAHVAQFTSAAPYLYAQSSQGDVGLCAGKTCHGNEVPLVFGYDNNGIPGLGNEVADLWSRFIQGKSLGWNGYKANANQQNANVKSISGGEIRNCPANHWGTQCTYYWQ